jgi:hypothetical protein
MLLITSASVMPGVLPLGMLISQRSEPSETPRSARDDAYQVPPRSLNGTTSVAPAASPQVSLLSGARFLRRSRPSDGDLYRCQTRATGMPPLLPRTHLPLVARGRHGYRPGPFRSPSSAGNVDCRLPAGDRCSRSMAACHAATRSAIRVRWGYARSRLKMISGLTPQELAELRPARLSLVAWRRIRCAGHDLRAGSSRAAVYPATASLL